MSDEMKEALRAPRIPEGLVRDEASEKPTRRSRLLPLGMVAGVLMLLTFGYFVLRNAEGKVNTVALSAEPKPVTAVLGRATEFRAKRRYVGTLEPWQQAGIGPQLVSGFVGTVLVRPGAVVKRGQVLATLDCRNASAASKAVALEARALEARQRAVAKEAARIEQMLEGGYVSSNEVEQALAQSSATDARIQGLLAQLQGKQLEVDDCIMRAPFSGEIAQRMVDPGAFVGPGTSIVTLVDRDVVRLTASVPEVDFADASPKKPVRIRVLATGQEIQGIITRRSPYADPETRTIRIEIDLADAKRKIPVGTTAIIELEVGEPHQALELPLTAATIRGENATVFVVRNERVEKLQLQVFGERGGSVFVAPAIEEGVSVVTEGRSLLAHGDAVAATVEPWQ